jgi:hypothetical protein
MEKWRLVSLLVRRKKETCAKLRCGVGHSMFMSLCWFDGSNIF